MPGDLVKFAKPGCEVRLHGALPRSTRRTFAAGFMFASLQVPRSDLWELSEKELRGRLAKASLGERCQGLAPAQFELIRLAPLGSPKQTVGKADTEFRL